MSLSTWTALDWLFAVIVLTSVGFALFKGLVREMISLAALVLGFVLATWYYPVPAAGLMELSRTQAVAELGGFFIIFLSCLLAGVLAAWIVRRFVKMAALEWLDYLLGGLFGLLRGWAVASIIVLALIAFPVRQDLVERSVFAPYLLAGARAAAYMVPEELKDKFNEQYKKVLQAWNHNRNTA
jgi:membrane protein required for colicin V production